MDLSLTTSAKAVVLSVEGLKPDGTPGTFASPPTFTVEQGTATLSEVADPNSQGISFDNTVTSTIIVRVDANCDLSGGTRIISARLTLSVSPAQSGPPSNEVVDLKLSAQ